MLKDIENLLMEGNYKFQSEIIQNPESYIMKKVPKFPILFLTCMDPRIDILSIFHLNLGDVFILRNAGNIVTPDMLRSIIITIYKYKVENIVVLGHFDCGMTKINMTDLRKDLPNELFKRLSAKYSEIISNSEEFFKLFNNEVSNVIHQINSLQVIHTFFPDVEIIGMIYDVQTGWIFTQDTFKDLLDRENHYKNYKGLLYEKSQQLSRFLELNTENINDVSKGFFDKVQLDELNLKEKTALPELEESQVITFREDEPQKHNDDKRVGLQISMPKIQVPKIYIPKLKVYIPKRSKIKDR